MHWHRIMFSLTLLGIKSKPWDEIRGSHWRMELTCDTDSEICQYLLNKETRMWRFSQKAEAGEENWRMEKGRARTNGVQRFRPQHPSQTHGGARPCLRTSYRGQWARCVWGRAGPGLRQRGCPTACWIATLSPHFKNEPSLYFVNTSCLS